MSALLLALLSVAGGSNAFVTSRSGGVTPLLCLLAAIFMLGNAVFCVTRDGCHLLMLLVLQDK